MKFIKKAFGFILEPIFSVAALIDESRRINEDGSWDKYWERKSRRLMKKEARRAKRGRV